MPEHGDNDIGEDLQDWIKQRLDQAVRELTDRGIVGSLLVEAKPAWVFPFSLLIGKVREKGETSGFSWVICDAVQTDHADAAIASSPRDVARHFALKWQLDAARGKGAESQLVERARALYELVNEESLWLKIN